MSSDPEARATAGHAIGALFHHIGSRGDAPAPALGGMGGQLAEFMEMPVELATVWIDASTKLVELILTAVEETGVVLVKGMTPA